MTRKITEVVIHHSYSPRDQKLDKSIASFNTNHKQRLTLPYNQPLSGVKGSEHVAYHWLIAGNGDYKRTRLDDIVGYHASNLDANNRSVGICLTGNFDEESPTESQMKALKEILKMYPNVEITGHRKYAAKSCPGKNFTDEMLKSLQSREVEQKAPEWARPIFAAAKKKGMTTDLWTVVGVLPDGKPFYLFHQIAVQQKMFNLPL